MEQLWSHLNWVCHLDYSYNFQKNDSTFGIDWLLRQFQTEVTLAEHEFIALRNYSSSFLNTEQDTTSGQNRSSRAAPLAMMALASIGLFGSRIARGAGDCRFEGFFGSCQEHSQENAAYLEKLSEFTELLAEDVFKLWNEKNQKFFMVLTEYAALKIVRKEMFEIQNRKRKLRKDYFEIFENKIHVLRDCDQLLFSTQHLNSNYNAIFPLLVITFGNIESYRNALYTYRINSMNSIQPMLFEYLPLSLVPRQSLLTKLNKNALEQWLQKYRLSVAIPMDEILAYYKLKLLRDVLVVEQGFFMRIANPLATKDSAFTVFRAIAVPMLQSENDMANKWKLEAPYLANSEKNDNTAFLTEYDLSRCIGSFRLLISKEMIATESVQEFCLTTV